MFNYFVNKALVFRAQSVKNMQSAPKYFGLAAVILFLNYLLISLLNDTLGIPLFISKVLTELILFSMSYIIQEKLVFRNRRRAAEK